MSQILKKIDIASLRIGMYIQDLSCDWMAHPFLRSRFLITTQTEIDKIRNTGIHGIHGIIIDTTKGLDRHRRWVRCPDGGTLRSRRHAGGVGMAEAVRVEQASLPRRPGAGFHALRRPHWSRYWLPRELPQRYPFLIAKGPGT